MKLKEAVKLYSKIKWKIEKFLDRENFEKGNPFEVSEIEGNLGLDIGINNIWKIITSEFSGGQLVYYDNTNAHIGVGDSTEAEDSSQPGLLGNNKAYAAMQPNYPIVNDTQCVFRAVFNEDEANFAWNEFVVSNGEGGANEGFQPINRKVSNQGVKAVGQVWQVTITITIT